MRDHGDEVNEVDFVAQAERRIGTPIGSRAAVAALGWTVVVGVLVDPLETIAAIAAGVLIVGICVASVVQLAGLPGMSHPLQGQRIFAWYVMIPSRDPTPFERRLRWVSTLGLIAAIGLGWAKAVGAL